MSKDASQIDFKIVECRVCRVHFRRCHGIRNVCPVCQRKQRAEARRKK